MVARSSFYADIEVALDAENSVTRFREQYWRRKRPIGW